MMDERQREQLAEWVERLIDDRLGSEEVVELERLLMNDREARELYLDLTGQHAQLHLDRVRVRTVVDEERAEVARPAARRKSDQKLAVVAAAAVCLLVALWFGRPLPSGSSAASVARLAKAEDASWGPSTLPTTVGSELGQGRLQLQVGLATIRFNSGAEVVLQGPAELEINGVLRGTLLAGTAVVEVPESAHGFTLDTPTASVIDHGTMFAVTVDSEQQTSTVDVLEGEVEVQHPSSNTVRRLHEKQTTVVTQQAVDEVEASSDEPVLVAPPEAAVSTDGFVRISTADGRGRDATAIQSNVYNHANPYLLFVKNCDDEYRRKGYMAFDLAVLEGRKVESARLLLTLQPSGFGYASLVPDSKFSVYGLVDESLDGWSVGDLRWETAPANVDDPGELNGDLVRKLGEFDVPRGRQTGYLSIGGAALRDLLNADTNGTVTLIVVRDTSDTRPPGLVHAFANHKHPTATPPTLELTLSE